MFQMYKNNKEEPVALSIQFLFFMSSDFNISHSSRFYLLGKAAFHSIAS